MIVTKKFEAAIPILESVYQLDVLKIVKRVRHPKRIYKFLHHHGFIWNGERWETKPIPEWLQPFVIQRSENE